MRCQQGRRKQRRCVRHRCRAPGAGISTAKRWHNRAAERRQRNSGEVTVRLAARGWDGVHEAACSRPHRRAPGAGIPAGVATGGSRAVGSGDGTPRRTATDATAHDGRWTLRWCKHSTGGRLDDGNFADEDTQHGAGEDLGKDEADRRAPSVNNGDTVMAGMLAHMRGWAGVGAELGRPQRKRPTMIFPI
jgi:hypothetical protein